MSDSSPADAALIAAAEGAGLAAWPALEEVRDGAWVVRLSEGHTGRANSLNVTDPEDDPDVARRLAAVAALFRRRGLVPTVRVTPLTPPALVARLQAEGWSAYGHSTVMMRPLAGMAAAGPVPALSPSAAWLEAMAAGMGFDVAKRDAIGRKLARAKVETGYLLHEEGGAPAATAMAALTGAGVILYEVGVLPACRRRGLGRRVVGAALGWAAARGAETAFLQVTSANAPAVALYRGLGFRPLHAYHYMRPPA